MVGIKHDFDWTGPGRGAKSCYIELKGTAKDIGLSGADKRVTIGQCGVEVINDVSYDGLENSGYSWPKVRPRALVSGTLFVSNKYRRQGLAQRLIREAECMARLFGVDEMLLLVDAHNAPALRLYQKLGYRQAGAPTKEHGGQVCLAKHLYFPTLSNLLSMNPLKINFVKAKPI